MSATEIISPRFPGLDLWPPEEAMAAMIEGQLSAMAAVAQAHRALTGAALAAAARLEQGGRLAYAGAGTSGRLAVLDSAELPPTFGWPRDRLLRFLAGGDNAVLHAVEGAEDDRAAAADAVTQSSMGPHDVLIAVAASGRTPYTCAAQAAARAAGSLTIGMANAPATPLLNEAEHPILLDTGAEVIAGSTRMKAGTAQKAALTLLSSLVMVQLGLVYDGMMVAMLPTNDKLRKRAGDLVTRIAGCAPAAAADALARAGHDIRLAVLLARGLSETRAKATLAAAKGRLRAALATLPPIS